MSNHLTALTLRGPYGLSKLQVNTSNILTVSSSIRCDGNIVNASFTGNIVFPEHLRDGVLYIQNGTLKTSNISEYEGGLVLPADITGNVMTIQTSPMSNLVYIQENTFTVDGTLYVTGYSTIDSTNTSIQASAAVRGTQFLSASDQRLKRNIESLDPAELDGVVKSMSSLRIKRWTDILTGRSRIGFVADDVEQVFPEAVCKVRGVVPGGCRGVARFDQDGMHWFLKGHRLSSGDRIAFTKASTNGGVEYRDTVQRVDEDRFFLDGHHACDDINITGMVVDDVRTIDHAVLLTGLIAMLQKIGTK